MTERASTTTGGPDDARNTAARGSCSGAVLIPDRAAAAATAAAGLVAEVAARPVVTCDGVEVTQVIQSMDHSVALIAGKETMVRVYLSVDAGSITVRGTLSVSDPAGPVGGLATVTSFSTVALDPGLGGDLKAKRRDLALSLNFWIPTNLTSIGSREFALTQLVRADTGDDLPVPPEARRTVSFEPGVPLRVRVLGIRFQGNGAETVEPADLDFELTRSWLGRAYPTPQVEWSRATVDGPSPWPFDADVINAFLRAVRFQDLQGGTDQRTHYYGMVADGGAGIPYFMRGKASAVPDSPDPSAVASGPTGVPRGTFAWDTDGSYGDWYAGHEIGHTFGRRHAEFCGAVEGAPFPFPNGQLSDDDEKFVGLDVGDPAHSIPPRALPGTEWHDLMTYCDKEWPSSFTYEGIKTRLAVEAGLSPTPAATSIPPTISQMAAGPSIAPAAPAQDGTLHVIATVNLTKAAGKIQQVQPYPGLVPPPNPAPTGRGPEEHLTLNLRDAQNHLVATIPAPFIPTVCGQMQPKKPTRTRTQPSANPSKAGGKSHPKKTISPPTPATAAGALDVPAGAAPEPARVDRDEPGVVGIVDAKVPLHAAAARIELCLGDKVLDSFASGPRPAAISNIRATETSAAARTAVIATTLAGPLPSVRRHPVITWDTAGAQGPTMAAAPETGPPNRYSVQFSSDQGRTWQTIGMGLQRPRITVDRSLLAGRDRVRIRITATDGFRSRVEERDFLASEL